MDAQVQYLLRCRRWRGLQGACEGLAEKQGWDGSLMLWKAFAVGSEGNVNQAIRELEEVRRRRDFELAAVEALLHFHATVKLVDHASVTELKGAQQECEARASELSMLLAAQVLLHLEKFAQARRFVQRILDKNSLNVKACTLLGWIEVLGAGQNGSLCGKGGSRRDISKRSPALAQFEQALKADRSGRKDIETLMGLSFVHFLEGRKNDAISCLDEVIVASSTFWPALMEKAKLYIGKDWDLAVETANRVLQKDPDNIDALRLIATFQCSNAMPTIEAGDAIQTLADALERVEPDNPHLWLDFVKPLVRLAERKGELIRKCLRIVEKAKRKAPQDVELAKEYAYQLSLLHNYDAAFAAYELASQHDESNTDSLYGQIYCLVKRGMLEEASQQLEFLAELQDTLGRPAQVTFLEALLAWKTAKDQTKSLKLLNETVQSHVKSLQSKKKTSAYDQYVNFNPDFMFEIAREYLQHAGSTPLPPGEGLPTHLASGTKLLEKVVSFVPSMLSAQIALARARYVANNLDQALKTVETCLKIDTKCAEAHLVRAQIKICQDDMTAAKNALEQALSLNFEIRDSVMYHLIKARILISENELSEAQRLLETTIQIPGICTAASAGILDFLNVDQQVAGSSSIVAGQGRRRASRSRSSRSLGSLSSKMNVISMNQRASVFIELSGVYLGLNEILYAKKVVKAARKEFQGSAEEVRVIVSESKIALKRNDVKSALRLLEEVPADSPAYGKAQMVTADIYLVHRNDKDAFIKCYSDLVERRPSAQGFVMLGEAFMRINRSDDAIEAFREALKRNPKDSELAKRIGKVLIKTHDYMRAIDYYKNALRTCEDETGRHGLRYDLSELYYNLGKFEKAGKELQNSLIDLDSSGSGSDAEGKSGPSSEHLVDLQAQVKALKLLAKVHESQDDFEKVIEVLNDARGVQSHVISLSRLSGTEATELQKQEMANLCILMAQHSERQRKDLENAIEMYNEALKSEPSNIKAMQALARLHLRKGDLEKCNAQCTQIVRVDENNEEASMMLADLMFQKNEVKMAIYHYRQLVQRQPNHFQALSRLVSLLYRAGQIETAEKHFIDAEHNSFRATQEPGYAFCKGKLYRYMNDINNAISEFNRARRDVSWGEQALIQMIEIYLNPDNANFWDEEGSVVDGTSGNHLEAVRTAEKLLGEIPDKSSLTFKLLQCLTMMATKSRADVEKAFQNLVEIVQENEDHVPSLLALSTALMMMKQTPKARNQLKRIAKMEYFQEHGESFERSWLLLADIYVQSGKYDQAQDLCQRCLKYNQSCSKAWEYMGMIKEKEASFAEAANNYEQAWKFERMASASVGYKLAFNYMKAKRHVEAIDVAKQVLRDYPHYPKIQKDILEKARASIRV